MVDFSKAPSGATHYRAPNSVVYFYKVATSSRVMVWSGARARWFPSGVFNDVSALTPIPEQK